MRNCPPRRLFALSYGNPSDLPTGDHNGAAEFHLAAHPVRHSARAPGSSPSLSLSRSVPLPGSLFLSLPHGPLGRPSGPGGSQLVHRSVRSRLISREFHRAESTGGDDEREARGRVSTTTIGDDCDDCEDTEVRERRYVARYVLRTVADRV